MSGNKKILARGIVLAVLFWIVLAGMFMPWFDGKNVFKASDTFFNTIAKGSSRGYIPELSEDGAKYKNKNIELTLVFEDEAVAGDAEKILSKVGMTVSRAGLEAVTTGSLGQFYEAVIKDSENMFYNKGDKIEGRYGLEEKQVMFVWWNILKAAVKDLNKKGGKENFAIAKYTDRVSTRGVEVAYNFYGIEPEDASSRAFVLIGALIFYIFYTLWWGFSIYYLAEGAGLKLTGGHKNEA